MSKPASLRLWLLCVLALVVMVSLIGYFADSPPPFTSSKLKVDSRTKERGAEYYNLARALYHQGEFEEAHLWASLAVQLAPQHAHAHIYLGLASASLGRYDEAVQSFDRALALDPSLEAARVNRAAVLEALGRKRRDSTGTEDSL